MTKMSNGVPVNDALNRPKNRLGIDYRVLLGSFGIAGAVALFANFLFGLILMFALPALVRWSIRKDAQIYKLWCLSFFQRAYYDPRKWSA